jgi:hypothetical protein
MIRTFDNIESIDLNPVFCNGERCIAVDARILPARGMNIKTDLSISGKEYNVIVLPVMEPPAPRQPNISENTMAKAKFQSVRFYNVTNQSEK